MACSFLAGAAPANAASQPFDFYASLYPEWKGQEFDAPSTIGTDVGHMGTQRNDTTVLTRDVAAKADTRDPEWSNSYIGVRGEFRFDEVTLGYDVQGLIDLNGKVKDNFRTRDAFVYVQHDGLGRISLGQMDTMYKEAGDPVRMLGVSSGNFVSTSRLLSRVGWKARGETSFHNRTNHMLAWLSPAWKGVRLGASHSFRAVDAMDGRDATLSAAALQWRGGPWYAALATEIHRDWLPLSLGADSAMPAAASIQNTPATTRSRDRAWRVSTSWTSGPWRLGADLARLHYSESDDVERVGKFRAYGNTTWQVSAERRFDNGLRLSANHVRASAGNCTLSGQACRTSGLGGWQTSLGLMYSPIKSTSVFALATHTRNNPAAQYASAPQGAGTDTYALGVKWTFD